MKIQKLKIVVTFESEKSTRMFEIRKAYLGMSKSYFVGFEKFLAYWILLMHIQFHFPEPKSIIFAQMKRERIAEDLYFHASLMASLFIHVLNPSDVTYLPAIGLIDMSDILSRQGTSARAEPRNAISKTSFSWSN